MDTFNDSREPFLEIVGIDQSTGNPTDTTQLAAEAEDWHFHKTLKQKKGESCTPWEE